MPLKKPIMFVAQGLPARLFGETYVAISVWQPSPSLWRAEYHILIRRPHEYLVHDVVDFDITDYPSELEPVNEALMVEEGLLRARADLQEELIKRAEHAGRDDLADLPPQLTRSETTLVALWIRGVFHTKILDMATVAGSPDLQTYLRIVTSMGRRLPGEQ